MIIIVVIQIEREGRIGKLAFNEFRHSVKETVGIGIAAPFADST